MKRAAILLGLLTLVGGCDKKRTEAVLIISSKNIVIPDEMDGLHVRISDRVGATADTDDVLQDLNVAICGPGDDPALTDCKTLPVAVVMFPGSMRPHDSVKVTIDATRKNQPVISNAALFTFAEGQSIRMDMVFFSECLGNLDCSKVDQACYDDAKCHPVTPTPFTGEPDLGVEDFAVTEDFGNIDLAPSFGDMAHDLAGIDLAGCVPQCSGKQCGSDGCLGSCGSCGLFEYCSAAVDQCFACGGANQFCCPTGQACKFTLLCDGTNHCVQPMVGMEPPCGELTQVCCNGTTCDSAMGLVCDGTGHCNPPPVDMTGGLDACMPNCAGKTCGPDGCGGVCGTCGSLFYCDITQNCQPCGMFPGDLCCPSGQLCAGGLTCDGANTCQPPFDMSMPPFDMSMPPFDLSMMLPLG
jgi:hypothetical protein